MTEIDINKLILAPTSGDPLVAMRRAELAGWTREAAIASARADDLELTPAHFAVIELLQKIYIEKGRAPHARYLATLLYDTFAAEGGSRYLYQLFPAGPVAQGSRLAGTPAPHDTKDLSFGSTY
ncbi:MAG: TusE/DsrC/DsvC family sulfur relay protein [Hyphomicrobiaceae bacterium]|nr:TusE/DsrC/DsvC family sulfur relay protein [Hyphomicrobiaceae bacterium]